MTPKELDEIAVKIGIANNERHYVSGIMYSFNGESYVSIMDGTDKVVCFIPFKNGDGVREANRFVFCRQKIPAVIAALREAWAERDEYRAMAEGVTINSKTQSLIDGLKRSFSDQEQIRDAQIELELRKLKAERDKYRAALQKILETEYQPELPANAVQCKHGVFYYNACDGCLIDFVSEVLK